MRACTVLMPSGLHVPVVHLMLLSRRYSDIPSRRSNPQPSGQGDVGSSGWGGVEAEESPHAGVPPEGLRGTGPELVAGSGAHGELGPFAARTP